MRQLPVQHVADDFHIAMTVSTEPGAGLHAVLIDHPQWAETHVLGIVIIRERKGVEALKPPMVGQAPFITASNLIHSRLRFSGSRIGSIYQIKKCNIQLIMIELLD